MTKSAARTWPRSSASAGSKFDLVTCFRGKDDDEDDEAEELKERVRARESALTGRCLFIAQAWRFGGTWGFSS